MLGCRKRASAARGRGQEHGTRPAMAPTRGGLAVIRERAMARDVRGRTLLRPGRPTCSAAQNQTQATPVCGTRASRAAAPGSSDSDRAHAARTRRAMRAWTRRRLTPSVWVCVRKTGVSRRKRRGPLYSVYELGQPRPGRRPQREHPRHRMDAAQCTAGWTQGGVEVNIRLQDIPHQRQDKPPAGSRNAVVRRQWYVGCAQVPAD